MQDKANGRKRLRSESDDEINGNIAKKLIPERYCFGVGIGIQYAVLLYI